MSDTIQALPIGMQITDPDDLAGQTIKMVFQGDDLKTEPFFPDLVIVTTSSSPPLSAIKFPVSVTITTFKNQRISSFVSPAAMARYGLLGAEAIAAQKRADELEHILFLKKSAEESRNRAADNLRWAERDESRAAALEAEIAQRDQAQEPQNRD